MLLSKKSLLFFCFLTPLAGCGWSPLVEPKSNPALQDQVGAFQSLATTGERRLMLVRTQDMVIEGLESGRMTLDDSKVSARRLVGRFGGKAGEFCAEPSPDAIESVATSFGAALSANTTGLQGVSEEIQLAVAKGLATSAAATFRRTQGLQMYRDGAFFLCQAVMNGYIDAAEYQEALFKLRSDAVDLMKAEFATGAWKTVPQMIQAGAPGSPEVKPPNLDGAEPEPEPEGQKPNTE